MRQYLIQNLTVKYGEKDWKVVAVNNANCKIEKGEIVAIVGKSGSGKSTLLNVLGGIEKPSSGNVFFNETNLAKCSDKELSKIRLNNIGLVFQGCYLVSTLSVQDNILLPAKATGHLIDKETFLGLTDTLGIRNRLSHFPGQLSGGEKQRVAIARALINKPEVILADEPTGNLDSTNSDVVFDLLINCAKTYGSTLIYVTHDQDKAKLTNRTITMKDGVLFE